MKAQMNLTCGFHTSTKDNYLEIKCNNKNQQIAWGIGGRFLSLHSSFVY